MEDCCIRCKKCRLLFEPDIEGCGGGRWPCPDCGTRNPNLRRHYRSIGLLFILALLLRLLPLFRTICAAPLWIANAPLDFAIEGGLLFLQLALLVVGIVGIYSAIAPWKSRKLRVLIWVVFSMFFLVRVVESVALFLAGEEPGLVAGVFGTGVLVFGIIFVYLFWLDFATKRALE